MYLLYIYIVLRLEWTAMKSASEIFTPHLTWISQSFDRAARQLYQLSFWACFCLGSPSQMWEWRDLWLQRGKCAGNTLIKHLCSLASSLFIFKQTFSQHANAIILSWWICVYVTPDQLFTASAKSYGSFRMHVVNMWFMHLVAISGDYLRVYVSEVGLVSYL